MQQSQPFKTEGQDYNEEDGEYYDYSDMLNCEINEENDNDNEEDENDNENDDYSDIPESEAYEINEDSKEEAGGVV